MAKVELLEQFVCPVCGEQHDDLFAAEHCCPREEVEVVLICSECEAEFDDDKLGRRDADDHLKTHFTIGGLEPEEVYLDALRFAQPSLGQWVTTMEAETDFLIPPDA